MNNRTENLTFSSLDPSQKSTFDSIIYSNDNLHVVHGPPGTGKSQLVVSLLERLFSREKKVLFVSQNTEALKVVERMILKTQKDIGYASDPKYVSLLDFCLMLYNPKHRQLKYLREQYSSLSGKQLPTIDVATKPFSADFNLKYTNLDHNVNYAIEGEEIGFDELISYFIKYVNQAMAPEPLRELDSIDVRGVLRLLDDYHQKEYFHQYNAPKRELILLSPKRDDITLPNVRRNIQDIKSVMNGEWMDFLAVKDEIDIMDYLNLLKEYASLKHYFDAHKLSKESVDIEALKNRLKDVLKRSNDIDSKIASLNEKYKSTVASLPLDIQGVSKDTESVTLHRTTLEIARENINSAVLDKDRIVTLISEALAKYPDMQYASVYDIWSGLKHGVVGVYNEALELAKTDIANKTVIAHLDSVGEITKPDLVTIIKDTNDFSEKIKTMGAVKRMLASVPNSIKTNMGITLIGDFEKYKKSIFPVLELLPSLMRDEDRIIDALTVSSKKSVPLSKMNVTMPSSIEDKVAAFAPVNELTQLLEKYEIPANDYMKMKSEVIALHKSLTTLVAVSNIPENKKFFIGSPLETIVESINIAIDITKCLHDTVQLKDERRELWNEAYNSYKELVVDLKSTDDFEKKSIEIDAYLSHKSEQIPKLFKAVNVPDKNMPLSIDFGAIELILQSVNSTDNFSDEFFMMDAGSTMHKWLDTISVLETYNNDNEVIEYTRHNKSINDIKKALGAANVKYVDGILSNDVSFDAFAGRIVNAIVGEVFGRANTSQKMHISTDDLLKSYERYLKSQRAISYRNTLRDLHSSTAAATRELSKQATLQASGQSTMEKFRHNTSVIIEAFPIVCATPKDVAKYIAATKTVFDYVIFDEASQLLPGQALPSIYRAQKTVIIGDPHQMPPNLNASFSLVGQDENDFDDLGESILDLVLKQPQRQHHLKVHYRSRFNKLFEPSRQAIYSKAGVEPIFEAELANGAPIDILDDLGDRTDEQGYDDNFSKVCEAVEEYIGQDKDADFCVLFTTTDVLQKFRSYIEEVGSKRYEKMSKLYDNDKILLSTVTNCQGIEGTYTVLYMHHYSRPGAMWFFKEQAGAYKRLNVSITRQREGLKLLLADPRSHWIAACDQKINSESTGPNASLSAQLMRSLLTNAGEQADEAYLDRTLGANSAWFDSPLTEQLHDKLTTYYGSKLGRDIKIYSEVGWNLVIPKSEGIDANERNVGFRIDLGIYSPVKKRFVLGIEMDGAMYHSGFEKEHSDYTRQKVLEAKGWDIYRVWSTNWLMDTEKEFNRLTQKIDKALTIDV